MTIDLSKLKLTLPAVMVVTVLISTASSAVIATKFADRLTNAEKQITLNSEDIRVLKENNTEVMIAVTEVKRDTSWMRAMFTKVFDLENVAEDMK